MLGNAYKSIPTCRWHCCRAHSMNKATSKHSLKRLRAKEKKAWRGEDW